MITRGASCINYVLRPMTCFAANACPSPRTPTGGESRGRPRRRPLHATSTASGSTCRRSPPSSASAARRSIAGSARAKGSSARSSSGQPNRSSTRREPTHADGEASLSSTRSTGSTADLRRPLRSEASSSTSATRSGSSRRAEGRAAPHGREDPGLHRGGDARAGFRPPVDPATLAYAIVRLAEAFLFNDATAAVRGDVERLREIEAALLGVPLPTSRPRGRCRRRAPRPRRARPRAPRSRPPRSSDR